jgi:A/G-specific adenine glycosylase
MLQQTQVSRVIERFAAFIARFPAAADLARADEHEVLALWSGLGYYRRARGLHAAARRIADMGGTVPADARTLRTLPGVGRYTAGAIASIVFGQPEPIVDGNVTRVLMRLEGRDENPRSPGAIRACWQRAATLADTAHRSRARGVSVGVFNEGMMELGALVCTPRAPACERCPLASDCAARRTGRQGEIPARASPAPRKDLHAVSLLAADARGRLLVERRPARGLWAGLWQAPTIESDRPIPAERAAEVFGVARECLIGHDAFVWMTTHRAVRFVVYRSGSAPAALAGREWVSTRALLSRALGSAQRRVLFGPDTAGEAGSRIGAGT